ncbi:MAG: glycosyltransferase [Actinobacteria bacterium]|nr:MAG: glycosyltransferase [Actinomycetota bacterium]
MNGRGDIVRDSAAQAHARHGTTKPMDRVIHWVLPAYNESASIADLLDRIAEVSNQHGLVYDILVVDDGSADDTGEIASRKADSGVPVRVVRNEPNRGLGFTIRRGLRESSETAGPDDIIITMDADLTQDPIYVPSMLAKIDDGYDVVVASRYRRGSGVEGLSGLRTLLSYGASALIALVRPIRGLRDYSCGFRAYRVAAVRRGFQEFGDDFISERGFACMLEIAQRLRDVAAFTEVPFVLRYDAKRKESAIKIVPTIGAYFRVIAKVAGSGRKRVPLAPLAFAFTSVFLGAFGQVFLRMGAQDLGGMQARQLLLDAIQRPEILVGLGLYAMSSVLWLGVLSRLELSVAYPLGASGYVLVVVLAALSGESVPLLRWAGVALIVLGVLLVGWLGAAPTVEPRRA